MHPASASTAPRDRDRAHRLRRIYRRLFAAFGPQGWWPARSRVEIVVGAVLTQNTAWVNVERALANLRAARRLSYARLAATSEDQLAQHLKPSGYYNTKARRLKALLAFLRARVGPRLSRLTREDPSRLREALLGVHGIGPETADTILLYAAGVPVFVVDGYTRRIFSRHRLVAANAPYETVQSAFMDALPRDPVLLNEYHALIVETAKRHCRTMPRCETCPLRADLEAAGIPWPPRGVGRHLTHPRRSAR